METIEYFYGPIGVFAYIFGIILFCALKDYCKRDDSAERVMEIEAALACERSLAGDGSAPPALKGSSSAAVTTSPPPDYSGQDTIPVTPEAQA